LVGRNVECADDLLERCWGIRPCLGCLRRCQRSATDDTSICYDAWFVRECRCCWAVTSARAFNVCDDANTAPQTTRAYAMMRGSCESADAVLEGCWGIRPCLECLRRCQHSATDDTSICNDACFMRECRCGWAGTSARAFNVCDGANTAPQTTRAYAMMRASCESADAVLEGC